MARIPGFIRVIVTPGSIRGLLTERPFFTIDFCYGSSYDTCIAIMKMEVYKVVPISIRLAPGIEKKLDKLAKKTGRTKSWYIRNAIDDYLQEWEDYYIALSRLENETGEVDISEVRKRLGLAG